MACPITSLNLCDQQPIENRDHSHKRQRVECAGQRCRPKWTVMVRAAEPPQVNHLGCHQGNQQIEQALPAFVRIPMHPDRLFRSITMAREYAQRTAEVGEDGLTRRVGPGRRR